MNRETPPWDVRKPSANEDDRASLRTLIADELPETRMFIDSLFREFTVSGRRLRIDRIVRKRGNRAWLSFSGDDDADRGRLHGGRALKMRPVRRRRVDPGLESRDEKRHHHPAGRRGAVAAGQGRRERSQRRIEC